MFICKWLTSIFVLMASPVFAEQDSNPAGWLWYKEKKEPEKPVEKKLEEKPEKQESSPPKQLTAVERLAVLQKEFEEVKAEAILNPTLENVTKTRRIHDQILVLSTNFQESWTLSETLDNHSKVSQTSPGALKIERDLQEKELDKRLRALSKTHGLLFVLKHDCPYCEGFAPLVVKFAQNYGFSVDGISSGEGCYEGMTCTRNTKAVQNINPEGIFPLLFLVNPTTQEVIPLARGYVSWNDLLANAKQVIKYLGEHS